MRTLLQRFLSLLNLPIPTRINRYIPIQPISLQNVDIVDDDDEDLDIWADAQVCDDCIELSRDYLPYCLTLDHAKHHHR
ncbi:MAG: hypothetical protein ACK56F_01175 [bacterium]